MKFRLTQIAKSSLADIAIYTQKTWGKKPRNDYLQKLDKCFHDIAESPLKGRLYRDINPDLYGHKAGKHIIFYLNSNPCITIIDIIHESMDLPNRLLF